MPWYIIIITQWYTQYITSTNINTKYNAQQSTSYIDKINRETHKFACVLMLANRPMHPPRIQVAGAIAGLHGYRIGDRTLVVKRQGDRSNEPPSGGMGYGAPMAYGGAPGYGAPPPGYGPPMGGMGYAPPPPGYHGWGAPPMHAYGMPAHGCVVDVPVCECCFDSTIHECCCDVVARRLPVQGLCASSSWVCPTIWGCWVWSTAAAATGCRCPSPTPTTGCGRATTATT